MENNVSIVRESKELAEGAAMLAKRCLDLAAHLIARDEAPTSIERGRKAHRDQGQARRGQTRIFSAVP
jgi:hypothetical protein